MSHRFAKVVDHKFGRGVVATGKIEKGEVVASFDGEVYYGEKVEDFPGDVVNFAISFGEDRIRHSSGIAHLLNHSCEPNCGIRGLFDLVAMRDIDPGEELCWDYDMVEDSDWEMDCLCGTKSCRGKVSGFRNLSEETREQYRGYISDWLVEKYELS